MKDYTLTLKKILGEKKYAELVDYTFLNVRGKFGDIKIEKATDIAKVNHQSLTIISILKAQDYTDKVIMQILHWKNKKSFKYIITDSYDNFIKIYEEYINLIIKFLKTTRRRWFDMGREKIFAEILKLIIGNDKYNSLITDAVHEYRKYDKYNTDDLEYILDSYMIAILLIGFSKKKIDIDKYSIHLVSKSEIKIDAKDFCEKYKKYIDQVEKFKFDLLRNLIQE